MGSRKTWVAERAKCDIGKLFEDLYAITQEVEHQWNKATKRKGVVKSWENTDEVKVERTDLNNEIQFQIIREEEIIQVSRNNRKKICKITTRWDKETSECLLVIKAPNDDPVEFKHEQLWMVVAYILEPLLFPPKTDQNSIPNPFATE